MSRTNRRKNSWEDWINPSKAKRDGFCYDRYNRSLKEETKSKSRSNIRQELSKFKAVDSYTVILNPYNRYDDIWNYD